MFRNTLINVSLTIGFLFGFSLTTMLAQLPPPSQFQSTTAPNTMTQYQTQDDDYWKLNCCAGICDGGDACKSGEDWRYGCNVVVNQLKIEDLSNSPTIEYVKVPLLSKTRNGMLIGYLIELANCGGCIDISEQLPLYPLFLESVIIIVGDTNGNEYGYRVELL